MKHFYKYFLPLFAAFGLLIGSGCSNIMDPPNIPDEGGLSITVLTSADTSEARTLLPSADFTKIVLSFSGPEEYADIELTDKINQAFITNLASGEWTITATGYVTINGQEYPAASGEQTIIRDSEKAQELSIPISAKQEGPAGFFSYSVQYPQAKVNNAYLTIIDITTRQPLFDPLNLKETASDTIELPPGYYLMTIQLSNEYQAAGHTEIIHIYSNMETKADYTYEDDDFVDLITLSGTATITVNGSAPPESMYLNIRALDENNGNYYAMLNDDNTWSMKVPAFNTETDLYFFLEYQFDGIWSSKEIGTHEGVLNTNIDNIPFSTDLPIMIYTFPPEQSTALTTADQWVPGEITATDIGIAEWYTMVVTANTTYNVWWNDRHSGDGSKTLDARVRAYYSNGDEIFNEDTGWDQPYSFTPSTDDTVYLKVNPWGTGETGSYSIAYNNATARPGSITLSGTTAVTVNGNVPEIAWVHIYADSTYNNHIASTSIDLTTDEWSVAIQAFDTETPVYFRVEAQSSTSGYLSKNIPDPTLVTDVSIPDIDLGPVSFDRIAISGTVNVTINGQKPDDAWINAFSDENYMNHLGNTLIDTATGTWSLSIEPFETENPVYFRVDAQSSTSGYLSKNIPDPTLVTDVSIPDIDLGTINFDRIIISGTVNVTINGQKPDMAYVGLYLDEYYNNQVGDCTVNPDNTWSISIESFATPTTLYIGVAADPGFVTKAVEETMTVSNENKTIDLGNIDIVVE